MTVAIVATVGWTFTGCRGDGTTAEAMDTGTTQGTPANTAGDTQDGAQTSRPPDDETGDPDSTGSDPDPSTESGGVDTSDPVPPGDTIYQEQFEGPDGDPWPDPWQVVGTQLISAELDGGRARFNGNTQHVARMALPGFSELDVDVAFTVTYDDYYAQGVGFYVRQNGGALLETDPPGEGYAIYIEGGFMQNVGVWRETAGVEEPLLETSIASDPLEDGVPYRVRFQCFTQGAQTRLRGRIWPLDEAEPGTWRVDTLDDTPQLQGTAGSFAADIYNYAGTASVYIDDVVITQLEPT